MATMESRMALATTIPTTAVYYSTFPPKEAGSPNSVIPTAPCAEGVKRLQPIQLSQIAKSPKIQRDEWVCPVSSRADKTNSSAKDLIQHIVDEVKLGYQRNDGKNPISLAVGTVEHRSLHVSVVCPLK